MSTSLIPSAQCTKSRRGDAITPRRGALMMKASEDSHVVDAMVPVETSTGTQAVAMLGP
jgi:hypothetical protein